MPSLTPCPACARHVASNEVQCPFCEAALPRSRAVGLGLVAAAGAGLALVTAGCPGNSSTGNATSTTPVDVEPGESEPDAKQPAEENLGEADPLEQANQPDPERVVQPPYGAAPPPPPPPGDDPNSDPDSPKTPR